MPVYDLRVKGGSLVAATHGRSFWVMDDLTPLRGSEQLAVNSEQSAVRLFRPLDAVRVLPDLFADWMPSEGKVYAMASNATYMAKTDEETGQAVRVYLDGGQGAPRGAILYYQLSNTLAEGVSPKLEILNASGQVIRSFGRKPAGWDKLDDAQKAMQPGPWIPVRTGLNRFVWDLREEGALRIKGNKTGGEAVKGPYALPGEYTVRLTVGEESVSQPLAVEKDPRTPVSDEALRAQYDALVAVRAQMNTLYENVVTLRRVQAQVTGWKERLAGKETAMKAADALLTKLAVVEDALILPGEQKNVYGLLVRPRLNAKLATVVSNINSADGRPTASSLALVTEYSAAINQQLGELHQILSEDVGEFNELVRGVDLPAVG